MHGQASIGLMATLALALSLGPPGRLQAEPGLSPGAESKAASETRGNLVGHGGPVKAVTVGAGRRRALTGSFDYTMMLWDLSVTPPVEAKRFDDHEGAVNAVAFLPDGRQALAAGDDGALWLWDLETGQLKARFKGHTGKIMSVVISADGAQAATSSWDRTVRIWDLARAKPGAVLKGHRGPVNAAAFSGDGKHIYTAGYDGTIRRWALDTGALSQVLYKHGWGINVLRRVPGTERLLFGSLDGAAGIVDAESGDVIKTLRSHEGPVLALDLIEKPGLAAIAGGDGMIRVYRMGDWALLESYHNPYGPVWAVAFADKGTSLYYGGLDDFVTKWQIRPREPFDAVTSTYPRRFQRRENMSLGERQFARKCSICHTLKPDGANRAGPTLYGLFGRKAGSLPGYPYSDALKSATIVWTEETVTKLFDDGPEHYTPGTKMPLQRIADAKIRNALVAFLKAMTARAEGPRPDKTKE